jgi:hypothetical protein
VCQGLEGVWVVWGLGLRKGLRGFVLSGYPAGAEGHVHGSLGVQCADAAGRERAERFGPAMLSVESDRVFPAFPWLEALDHDQRVVVAGDVKRARSVTENLDLGWAIGFHPDRGLTLTYVAQQRSQDQLRHVN